MPDYTKPIFERGVITAPRMIHDLISAHCPAAYKITSWQNGKSPQASAKLEALARAKGFHLESIFDARHGKRYMCFAYFSKDERKALWDFQSGGAS